MLPNDKGRKLWFRRIVFLVVLMLAAISAFIVIRLQRPPTVRPDVATLHQSLQSRLAGC
jgi:hypothetical protein